MQIVIQEFDKYGKTYYRATLICDKRIEEGLGFSVKDATINSMAIWMNKYKKQKEKLRKKMRTDKDRFPVNDTQNNEEE